MGAAASTIIAALRQRTVWRITDKETFRNPHGVRPGDLVLMRLEVDAGVSGGLAVPPGVAGDLRTSGMGEQPALGRKTLLEWDRVGVVVDWAQKDGKLVPQHLTAGLGVKMVPCVAIAMEETLEVWPLVEILEDPKYTVVAFRRVARSLAEAAAQGGDDAEQGRAMPQVPQDLLDEAVHRMVDHKWDQLEASSSFAASRRGLGTSFGRSVAQDFSLRRVFERLREWTSLLHARMQDEARAQGRVEAPETDVSRFFRSSGQEQPAELRRSAEEILDARTRVRRRLTGAVHATHAVEELAMSRIPSEEEWTQLLSLALKRPMTREMAMRVQVQLCTQCEISVTEAETALLMCCGEFDLGAPLSAEVLLHLLRCAGVCRSDAELGGCWIPAQFDVEETSFGEALAEALSGEDDGKVYLDDVLHPGMAFQQVEIVKHTLREWRNMQGRVVQGLDQIVDSLEALLPREIVSGTTFKAHSTSLR